MAKKNKNTKPKATTKPKAKVKEKEEVVEETVEEETVDEALEEEETVDEETEEEDEVESEVETEDATGEVTRYGVYIGETAVAILTLENHGKDFKKIAEAKAKAMGGKAKPYTDPAKPETEKTVVNVVNGSNSLVRQYSLSAHGKDYKKLAESFVEKHGVKRGLRIKA